MVFGLPCAGMKKDCHGGADKGRLGLLTENRLPRKSTEIRVTFVGRGLAPAVTLFALIKSLPQWGKVAAKG